MPRKIEISHKTIIFTVFFLIFLWFLYSILDIILLFFISILIATILNPAVKKLSRLKIPRGMSVIIVYLTGAALLIFSIGTVISPLVEQSRNFATNFPIFLERLQIPEYLIEQITTEITSEIGSISSQILKIGVSIFSNILTVFAVLIISLYFSIAREKLADQLRIILASNQAKRVETILDRLEIELGGWTRGQLALMFLVGISTYVGLRLLRIPYAVPLAVLSGFLEVIPNIGPVVAAIPAIVVGFGISPITGLAVLALSFLVQQVENYFFVPKIMEKSVGISPVVTLLALLIGFRLGGIVGAMLSVPVLITLRVILHEYFSVDKLGK
ncbi:hypothetical protein A2715_00455 [Candidatus Woesebacteria bacterium RIFCSPHIGHO2_01_FULL_39_32]|nr:MAG: hypothetical protein A2124_04745 [Candidatus Woesebacteria bacterium GWB1_37_5]OGM24296.1 MAG: hypothetical protein A2715_00455 [Candidatus Woesebacteria bacterium RIFCSPHIGHO2_01_FULL_39_32]OGM35422.1 MAG: hypothetical protein A3F01_04810 [Candidatus Woesebacteria bacterium RIFCSPHIGHO2_12_FULL_38_11]OGM65367.1 MAG: hypothetical protein A2893_01410 [Candidatus Woesebacteria bacterium RIFCSPLOWO2_01_FULL_39_25]